MMKHTFFHQKLEAVGFGVFIPSFFVTSGMLLDVGSLFSSGAALAPVPVFLLALLLARGLPAVLYRSQSDTRGVLAAGLLQATSLPFIVASSMIGMQLGLLSAASGAALVVLPADRIRHRRGARGSSWLPRTWHERAQGRREPRGGLPPAWAVLLGASRCRRRAHRGLPPSRTDRGSNAAPCWW